MAKRLSLGRLEKMVEDLNRDIDLEGSDVTVNSLTADQQISAGLGLVATAGGIIATAGGITATAGGLTVTAGQTILRGESLVVNYLGGVTNLSDDNAAITSAEIRFGLVHCTPTAARTKALPTAGAIRSEFGIGAVTGDAIDLSVVNLAAVGSGFTLELTPGANTTLAGNFIIQPGTASVYRIRTAGATVITIYQVG